MSLTLDLNPIPAARPGRRIALVCLIVAAASAITSFAIGSPLMRNWQPSAETDWLLPFIAGALSLVAMLVSAAGLFSSKRRVAVSSGMADLRVESLIRQLDTTLAGQREQIALLQRGCETATRDAAEASARAARVADAAIDAQTRLADGLARFEEASTQQWDAKVQTAGVAPMDGDSLMQRIEAALPALADMVRDRLANFPDPSFDIAASRLNATVTTAMESFRGVVDEANRKIASLNEISQALRRDAVALDLAGREIATAGATVVARASDTITNVDTALAGLPSAVAAVTAAAGEMKGCMAEATLTMRADRAALMAAGENAEQAASRMVAAGAAIDSRRQAIDGAADRIAGAIATVIAKVDAAEEDRHRLSDLTTRLREAADVLNDGTAALTRASRDSAGATDATLDAIRGAAWEMVTHIRDALAPLPAATEALAVQMQADIAGQVATAVNGTVTDQIDTAITTLTDAMRITPAIADGITNDLTARLVPHLDTALNALTEAELRLAERGNTLDKAGERAAETCVAAARSLSAASETLAARTQEALAEREAQSADDNAFIGRVAAALEPFTANTQASVRMMQDATDALTTRTDQALARLPQVVAAAADALTARTDEALVRIPAAMIAAADTLTQRTDEALVRVPTAMATAADALAARTEAALARVPVLVTAATETLTARADEALARVPEVMAAATDLLATRTDAVLARLPEVVAEASGALARDVDYTLARVPAVVNEAAATLSARIAEAAQCLPIATDAMVSRLTEAAQAIPQASDAMTARIADAVATIPAAADALTASAHEATNFFPSAAEALVSRIAEVTQTIPATADAVIAAAARSIQDVAAGLDDGRMALDAAVRSIVQEAEILRASGQHVTETDRQTLLSMLQDVHGTIERLSAVAAQNDEASQALANLTQVGMTLDAVAANLATNLAANLAEGVEALDIAARRVATVGESAIADLSQTAARHQTALETLPAIAHGIGEAANRLETQFGAQFGEQLDALTPKLTHLDQIGQRLETVAAQLPGDLTATLRDAIPASLPDVAARLDAIATRLPVDLAVCLSEAVPAALPNAAERLAVAAPRLDAVAVRLEGLAERLPATIVLPNAFPAAAERLEALLSRPMIEPVPDAAVAALATLSGDLGEAVRRVETALGEHEGARATLMASMDRVQSAVTELQAARAEQMTGDGSLDAALTHLNSVGTEAERLLWQAEALAEAVMAGRAPGIASVLADRAPSLLTSVETAARRLRSAATALAIASDGTAGMAASEGFA